MPHPAIKESNQRQQVHHACLCLPQVLILRIFGYANDFHAVVELVRVCFAYVLAHWTLLTEKIWAIVSLRITDFGCPLLLKSLAVKSRPASSTMPVDAKYRGITMLNRTRASSFGFGSCPSATRQQKPAASPSTSPMNAKLEERTP